MKHHALKTRIWSGTASFLLRDSYPGWGTGVAKDIEARLGFTAKEAEAIVVYRNEHGDFRDWGEMPVIYRVDGKKVDAVHARMNS